MKYLIETTQDREGNTVYVVTVYDGLDHDTVITEEEFYSKERAQEFITTLFREAEAL